MFEYIEFNAAGVTFEDRQKILKELYEKNMAYDVVLVPEPGNAYDPNAIQVVLQYTLLDVLGKVSAVAGYIPADKQEEIKEAKIYKYSLTKHPKKDIVCLKLTFVKEVTESRLLPEEVN